MKNKITICILCMMISKSTFSQITISNGVDQETSSKNQAYVFINRTNTFRNLEPNYDFIPGVIGDRANEKSLNTYSFGIGLKGFIHKNILWDGGLTFLQNGEKYNFEAVTSDTSFAYQTYYKYISMPIKLNFSLGKSIKIFGGVGLLPQLFLGYRQNQQWETSLGNKENNTIKTKDGFNTFVISTTFNLGISFHSKNGYGLFINPEYRLQIMNGLAKTSYFRHKSYGMGVSFGILKEL